MQLLGVAVASELAQEGHALAGSLAHRALTGTELSMGSRLAAHAALLGLGPAVAGGVWGLDT